MTRRRLWKVASLWSGVSSLRVKILTRISLLVLVLMVGTLALVSRAQLRALTGEVELRINATAVRLAIQFLAPVIRGENEKITNQARDASEIRDVTYVAVLDSSRALLTETSSGFYGPVLESVEFQEAWVSGDHKTVRTVGADGREVLTRIAPIVRFNVVKGAVLVGFNRERILGEVTSLRRTVLALGAIGLLAGIVMAVFLARGVIGPVERLKDAALRVGAGKFGETVKVETEDEIGALAKTFNTMSLELKRREEEVRRAERLSAIGTTASAIAHEMKTPLTSVQTYLDMLMYQYDDPEFRGKFTATIEDQVTRLQKLVDDLLDYSRDTRLHPSSLDLNLHLHQAVAFFGEMLVSHKVAAFEDYQAQQLVKADPDKMEQVFFNLIKNGIEAQGEGGAIAALTREENGSVLAMIADSGRGIPEETARAIFEPFYTTKSKGTGLGLAIARKIVEAHGGEITLRTPLGRMQAEHLDQVRHALGDYWPGTKQGACFLVWLPAFLNEEV